MKAKLDGNDVEVIILDPPAAFAVEEGVMGGIGVESIGTGAFMGMDLFAVKLPSTLKEIGDHAFWRVDKMSDIVIPPSVRTIEFGAFSETTSIHLWHPVPNAWLPYVTDEQRGSVMEEFILNNSAELTAQYNSMSSHFLHAKMCLQESTGELAEVWRTTTLTLTGSESIGAYIEAHGVTGRQAKIALGEQMDVCFRPANVDGNTEC